MTINSIIPVGKSAIGTLIGAPFQFASSLRRARAFHPYGLELKGTLKPATPWWPVSESSTITVSARMSKALGTPGDLPDVLGLALRLHDVGADEIPWDILLATSGLSTFSKMFPAPAFSWNGARYSTLVPYSRAGGAAAWLIVTPRGVHPTGTSLPTLKAAVDHSPLHFSVYLARIQLQLIPIGHLCLDEVADHPDCLQPSFDPILNRPTHMRMLPEWLAETRKFAYRGSRNGRGDTQKRG